MRQPPRPITQTLALNLATAALSLGLASCSEAPTPTSSVTPPHAQSLLPPPTPSAPDVLEEVERRVEEGANRARESVVALEYSSVPGHGSKKGGSSPRARRVASGVVVSDDGHVISVRIDPPSSSESADAVVARDASGRRFQASWVAADPETGLTLLKIAPGAARPAVASTRGARLGLSVLVIGNPFGLAHSVSRGAVSGLDRRLDLGRHELGGLIQVDASLHPGDSGALVADLRGGWIGLIRSGLAPPDKNAPGSTTPPAATPRDGESNDLGFAIPAQDALWVASRLRDRRHVDRAFLGVSMRGPADPPDADSDEKDEKSKILNDADVVPEPDGVALVEIGPDTPAARAGLRPGDRVVGLDDHSVRTRADLTDRLDRTAAGSDVVLTVARGPARHRVTVRTGSRPKAKPTPAPDAQASASTPRPARPPADTPTADRAP